MVLYKDKIWWIRCFLYLPISRFALFFCWFKRFTLTYNFFKPSRLREILLYVYLGYPIIRLMQISVSSAVHLFSTCWKCELWGWLMNIMVDFYSFLYLWQSSSPMVTQDWGIGGSLQCVNQAWRSKTCRFFLQAVQWKVFFIAWGEFSLYGCLFLYRAPYC